MIDYLRKVFESASQWANKRLSNSTVREDSMHDTYYVIKAIFIVVCFDFVWRGGVVVRASDLQQ